MRHSRTRTMHRMLTWLDKFLMGFSISVMLAVFWAVYFSRNIVI